MTSSANRVGTGSRGRGSTPSAVQTGRAFAVEPAVAIIRAPRHFTNLDGGHSDGAGPSMYQHGFLS